ncbi:MAG: hypothetical protein PHW13_08890 [Methylococcales bacterium]|nr:hypothetical protein [Methylococcales bacterium]
MRPAKLSANRKKLIESRSNVSAIEDEVAKLPNGLRLETEGILEQWRQKYAITKSSVELLAGELKSNISKDEEILEKTFKELPTCEGKIGRN